MMTLEKTEVNGWEAAIRGMRNPYNSWDKSDSYRTENEFHVGEKDMERMISLVRAGSDHSKFMRMITVTVDIKAPLYWWKEFDTYKVGTVRNSCSTMHKIADKEFTLEDFSVTDFDVDDDYNEISFRDMLTNVVADCEFLRKKYLATNDKKYWRGLIQLLPSNYNQRSTVQLNYQVLRNMYHARKNHKLDEWHDFCRWVESLPYAELIIGGDKCE